MLIGYYIQRLGEKGRTALPGRFREEMGQGVIISRWYEKSLAIFDIISWKKIIETATGGISVTSPSRGTERFLLGGAYEIELDSQGRFVIPKPLRDWASLGNEIIFVGLGNRVEVWNKEAWETHEKEISEHAEELIEKSRKLKNE